MVPDRQPPGGDAFPAALGAGVQRLLESCGGAHYTQIRGTPRNWDDAS